MNRYFKFMMSFFTNSELVFRMVILFLYFILSPVVMSQGFSLIDIFETPYFSQLRAAGETGNLVFAVNEQGHRNVYIARYPGYSPENLTRWNEDLGLEITSLSVSNDGQWAVFVRGGEHGGNRGLHPVNPASLIEPQQISLYTIHLPSGKVTLLGEGDFPVIHPGSKHVTFLINDQVWITPVDGSSKPKQLFQAKGAVKSMQWSPDGEQLLFESDRGSYAFIGIFKKGEDRICWVSPSYHRDRFPRWSPDGKSVAFIRILPTSNVPRPNVPWRIMVANLDSNETEEIWVAPNTTMGRATNWPGNYNLRWVMDDAITFLSYMDGWPHLYKINPYTREVLQLTKGDFTVDQINYSGDGKKILLAVNTGDRPDDIDRKHIGIVDVPSSEFTLLTKGKGIETDPVFVRQTDEIAFFSSTPHRPTLPSLMKVNNPRSRKEVAASLLPDFDYHQLVTPKHISFQSEDGHPVFGQLFKPDNLTGEAPAIVYIHGGPQRQTLLGWHFSDYYFHDYMVKQHLVSLGYIVLSVNYRLSTGYGFDFQYAKNTGGRNGISEYQDILAAGKWLADQSFVDSDRIGVWGGSYGGFLTAMALSRNSDVFKVGVDIHGAHYRMLKGTSPNSSVADSITLDWKSPVLIIHGDDDQNVAFKESIDLANRLIGKGVDVEYLVFPDENHHWMLFENLIKVNQATVQFFKERIPVNH